jgi:hypothetical protein
MWRVLMAQCTATQTLSSANLAAFQAFVRGKRS